jgi:hypothetical protein
MLHEEELTGLVIGAAIEVHRELGPVCWNLHTKHVYVTNSDFDRSRSRDKL